MIAAFISTVVCNISSEVKQMASVSTSPCQHLSSSPYRLFHPPLHIQFSLLSTWYKTTALPASQNMNLLEWRQLVTQELERALYTVLRGAVGKHKWAPWHRERNFSHIKGSPASAFVYLNLVLFEEWMEGRDSYWWNSPYSTWVRNVFVCSEKSTRHRVAQKTPRLNCDLWNAALTVSGWVRSLFLRTKRGSESSV